jgi:hypothetical protein
MQPTGYDNGLHVARAPYGVFDLMPTYKLRTFKLIISAIYTFQPWRNIAIPREQDTNQGNPYAPVRLYIRWDISWLCFVRPALQSRRKMRGARIVYSDRRRSGLHEALHNRAVAVSMRISSRSTKQTACLRHSSCQINLASVHNPAICLHPGIQSQSSLRFGTFGVGALKQNETPQLVLEAKD